MAPVTVTAFMITHFGTNLASSYFRTTTQGTPQLVYTLYSSIPYASKTSESNCSSTPVHCLPSPVWLGAYPAMCNYTYAYGSRDLESTQEDKRGTK